MSSVEHRDTDWTMEQIQIRLEQWAIEQINKRLKAICQAINHYEVIYILHLFHKFKFQISLFVQTPSQRSKIQYLFFFCFLFQAINTLKRRFNINIDIHPYKIPSNLYNQVIKSIKNTIDTKFKKGIDKTKQKKNKT